MQSNILLLKKEEVKITLLPRLCSLCKYYQDVFICQIIKKIFGATFWGSHSTRPAACLNCSWFYCNRSSAYMAGRVQLSQIYINVETERRTLSKYSVLNHQLLIKFEGRNKCLLLRDSIGHIVQWEQVIACTHCASRAVYLLLTHRDFPVESGQQVILGYTHCRSKPFRKQGFAGLCPSVDWPRCQ